MRSSTLPSAPGGLAYARWQPPMARRQARIAGWLSRLFDRLARSSRVFLLSVVIACGVEVLVDWNQTLFEINVLRDQKAEAQRQAAARERELTARLENERNRIAGRVEDRRRLRDQRVQVRSVDHVLGRGPHPFTAVRACGSVNRPA